MKWSSVLLVVTVLVVLSVASDVSASDLWMIDTRQASMAVPDEEHYHRLTFECWDATRRRFAPSTRQEFLATSDSDTPLLFLIHGNWMKRSEAVTLARDFHRRVEHERCRVIMWTWPSEKVSCRPRVDINVKATRADRQASYVVWFLRELKQDSRVTLAGFSLGARLAAMALEEMATYEGEPEIRLNTILMAAAFDSNWLLPGHRFEHAFRAADRCDILYNPMDDKLCLYPHIDSLCGRGPTALGATGLPVRKLETDDQPRVRSINVSRWIGADHSFASSLRAMLRYDHFREIALFEEP